MDRKEEWRQLIEEYREVSVPQEVRDRMWEAVVRGKKRVARRRRKAYISAAVSGAAAVVLILVLLPNLNARMAERMGGAPVVGGFFRAVTVREYAGGHTGSAADENGTAASRAADGSGAPMARSAGTDSGFYAADGETYGDTADAVADDADMPAAALPGSEGTADAQEDADGIAMQAETADGGNGGISARAIQTDTDGYTEWLMACFEEENVRNGGRFTMTGYEVVTDSDDWFTLIIYADADTGENAKEPEGFGLRRYYNVDKKQDAVMTLGELYNDRDYVTIISTEILSQMEARKAQETSQDTELPEAQEETGIAFTRIAEDQNYYFNADGNLVIVLDQSQTDADTDEHSEYVIASELLE